MTRLSLLATLAVALVACGGGDDPFTADMKTICSAGGDPSLPPELRRLEGARTIADKLRTPEAARLMAEVARAAPAERPALIAPALARAKLSRCPFLDSF